MSYLALYRKYRPTNFLDLVGQSEVVTVIKNEILNDKISHAYLFSGPRGTGKTSTAKIIAKMINCSNLGKDGVPCGKCESCINFDSSNDIVEIDAASNNGVDEIRDLRDKVNLVPTYGKYKVYIIDEVHMLTTQAFNALLKTLEEPPSHIVFILATTEFYKIPITVVSRCQKFQFLRFSNAVIVDRLSFICEQENINCGDNVLSEIARLSEGGMRDAINMLDQLSSFSDSKILLDDVYKLNGVLSYVEFSGLLKYICNRENYKIVEFVENVEMNGKNLNRFATDFLDFLKDLLVFKGSPGVFNDNDDKKKLFDDLNCLLDIDQLYGIIISVNDLIVRLHTSSFPKILLIAEFIKISCSFVEKGTDLICDESVADDSFAVKKINKGTIKQVDNNVNSSNTMENVLKNNSLFIKISDRDKVVRVNNAFALASKEEKDSFLNNWDKVVEKVSEQKEYFSVTSMIRDIDVMVVGGNYIVFVAKYDSLLDRLFENINVIEKLLFEVYNISYKVIFLASDEWNYEKDKYVDAFKKGDKYVLMDDTTSLDAADNFDDDKDDDVEKIISLLGNDVISYE